MNEQHDDDARILACSHVQECAALGIAVATELLAAATACDLAGVEARLWAWRRVLAEAARVWREVVPASDKVEGDTK
jgi:hypothetical protein